MDKSRKYEFVKELHNVFLNTGVLVVAHYATINVAQMTDLRCRMRELGAGLKVVKNRLARRALQGTNLDVSSDLFEGPTLIAYSVDPVIAPKILFSFTKEHEALVILGGAMGSTFLDYSAVKMLAELPSLDELRGRLLGIIQVPAIRVACVTQAPAAQLARVLNAYANKEDVA
ncbi:MAG: 50S ribosomal protein L10 [Alphaproteobacteria bacterium]|nr:50S ribosomal protein L10 [Alphaproteobacteria bacterium]